jgi:DNA-binding transcriptional LysR family regulator
VEIADQAFAKSRGKNVRFDLTDLRLFLHVAEARSITHGAERANLALASASARVRGMEKILGVDLLQRNRRGVVLTPAGQSLLDHARLVLQQVERMRSDLGAYARGLRGRVHVLANTAALTEHLPGALAAFLAANPNVDLELDERESAEIVARIGAGQADIGIASDAIESGAVSWRPFRADRLVLAVAQSDPLATVRRAWFRDILHREFVGLPHSDALQRHIAGHAAREGATLRLRVCVGGFDAVCRMVEAGAGIAIVPEAAAKRCRRSMAIRLVSLHDVWSRRRLGICVRKEQTLPAAAKRLLEHLQQAADRPTAQKTVDRSRRRKLAVSRR